MSEDAQNLIQAKFASARQRIKGKVDYIIDVVVGYLSIAIEVLVGTASVVLVTIHSFLMLLLVVALVLSTAVPLILAALLGYEMGDWWGHALLVINVTLLLLIGALLIAVKVSHPTEVASTKKNDGTWTKLILTSIITNVVVYLMYIFYFGWHQTFSNPIVRFLYKIYHVLFR